ncbi:MAG: glycoside hydrolase family 3 C-terminal domain-containing protein [Clostridia bacterium]|nr:glycoside hydrolase family 3 C-terminal domain-containing protein [Clostridia bacterium]
MEKYRDPNLPIEERLDDLMSRMTLEEKVAQLDMRFGNKYCTKRDPNHGCSVAPDSDYNWEKFREEFADRGVGVVHDNYSVPALMNKLQRWFVEETRLGIPALFTAEALHGITGTRGTILPIPTSWAATFDPEAAKKAGEVIGTETRALGLHEILAPNLDVARDPRWGRTEETFGEDTYLSSRMAVAVIQGEQKGDISRPDAVIAEPKHYCVHGIPEGGVNCAPARVGIREVETAYLPVFEAGIREGGAYNVMVSYNCIDSDLLMTSEHYLKDVLKDRLGLKGICRSDWGGLRRVHYLHKLAKNEKEAIYLAKKNGLDCQGGDEYPHLVWLNNLCELVREGRIPEDNINDSCRRILRLKFMLGLFETPYTDETNWENVVLCDEHKEVALDLARKAITLLKNDGILPLKPEKYSSVALIGPSSADQKIGGYSAGPVGRKLASVYDVLQKELGGKLDIRRCDGCGISGEEAHPFGLADQQHLQFDNGPVIKDSLDEAVELAKNSDLIIFVGGDDRISSGEGRDRCELTLCGRQRELLLRLSALGKPLILVLENGKPLDLSAETAISNAIVEAWFNGEMGAYAIVDALLGKINPAGRLPFSLPRRSTMIPCYYSMLPGSSNEYYEGDGSALYPFGFGLSYTSFEYSDLSIEKLGATDVRVRLNVKNVGEVPGDEVVQLYVEDCESTVVTPPKLLKGFRRISLEPSEEKTVTFDLDEKAFRLMNARYEWVVEPGDFRIMAGASSRDIRLEGVVTL